METIYSSAGNTKPKIRGRGRGRFRGRGQGRGRGRHRRRGRGHDRDRDRDRGCRGRGRRRRLRFVDQFWLGKPITQPPFQRSPTPKPSGLMREKLLLQLKVIARSDTLFYSLCRSFLAVFCALRVKQKHLQMPCK